MNAFSSRYDAVTAGKGHLTPAEARGEALFMGKAGCVGCHPPPLFTDYTFDNLGVPRNEMNPFYFEPAFNPAGRDWIDNGLGGFLASRADFAPYADANLGRHKVATLRNVDKRPTKHFVKAYGHNGYFKSLKSIVHFYNTRDVLPTCPDGFSGVPGESCWPAAEVPETVNHEELGNLGLTDAEEDDVVAFLSTLSDEHVKSCNK